MYLYLGLNVLKLGLDEYMIRSNIFTPGSKLRGSADVLRQQVLLGRDKIREKYVGKAIVIPIS